MTEESRSKPFVIVALAVLVAVALVHQMHRCGDIRTRNGPSVTLDSKHAHFTIFRDGRLRIESDDHTRTIDAELVIEDDEGVHAIAFDDLRASGQAAHGREKLVGAMDLSIDAARDAIDLAIEPSEAGATSRAIAVRVPLDGRSAFLSGRGELADLSSEYGKYLVLGDVVHPLGVVANGNMMHVTIESMPGQAHTMAMRASVPVETARMTIALANAGGAIWSVLFDRAKADTKRVKGLVTGAPGSSQVFGLDDEGAPHMRVGPKSQVASISRAPESVKSWYASASASRTSAPIIFHAGLAVGSPPRRVARRRAPVRVTDGDTGAPLTARVVVHGIEGTLDPSFGPDFRASGAGPLIDALRGELTTPLPAGRYRVAATKGIEWSIDAQTIAITSGHSASRAARAPPRRPHAGRGRLRSPRARAPELRLAGHAGGSRVVARRVGRRLRGAERAQHRRRLRPGDRDRRTSTASSRSSPGSR